MTQGQARPRFKATLPVYRVGECLYVQKWGSNVEVPDADGTIERFIGLLDGARTLPELRLAMSEQGTELTHAEITAAVEQLDEAGFLEDGAVPAGLDEESLVRWKRNLGFLESYSSLATSKYELQRRLRDCKIVIMGLGGVGSHLLFDLAGLGMRDIRVVDFDTVELSNLNRQILYTEGDIGNSKTEAAARRILAYDSHIKLDVRTGYLGSADDVLEVIEGRDIVLSAVDMPKMQIVKWVNQACVTAGATLITGGVDNRRIAFYTMIPGVTGCVECWKRDVEERDDVYASLFAKREEWANSSSDARFPEDMSAFGPLVVLYTALVLGDVVRLATGVAPAVSEGRVMEAHFDDGVLREAERWSRRPDCPVCATVTAEHAVA
jgi:molybdopterin/thiamine biosynthesis adenylyltransferase